MLVTVQITRMPLKSALKNMKILYIFKNHRLKKTKRMVVVFYTLHNIFFKE